MRPPLFPAAVERAAFARGSRERAWVARRFPKETGLLVSFRQTGPDSFALNRP